MRSDDKHHSVVTGTRAIIDIIIVIIRVLKSIGIVFKLPENILGRHSCRSTLKRLVGTSYRSNRDVDLATCGK
jgi:hypothetical protein